MALSSFFASLAAADAMAAFLPLVKYKAGADDKRLQWLVAAAIKINSSRKWQGQKVDPQQPWEFPRIPYPRGWLAGYVVLGGVQEIWDWDLENGVAVIPNDLLMANLYEANSIAGGKRDRIIEAIESGLTMQQTGSLIEQYRQDSSGISKLCVEAESLVAKYVLSQGEYL